MTLPTALILTITSHLMSPPDAAATTGPSANRPDPAVAKTDHLPSPGAPIRNVLCRRIEHEIARQPDCIALTLDTAELIRKASLGTQTIRDFPVEDDRTVDLELTRFSIRSSDTERPGSASAAPLHLRGQVIGVANSSVFLSTSRAGTFGWINVGDDEFILSTGRTSGPGILTCYRQGGAADHSIARPTTSLQALEPPRLPTPPTPRSRQSGSASPDDCRELTVSLFGDSTYTSLFDGDVDAANGYMETLFAAVSEIFAAQVNLRLVLEYQEVFVETAPFSISVDDCPKCINYHTLLRFGEWWERVKAPEQGLSSNAAYLFTGQFFDPLAWAGSACYENLLYRTGLVGIQGDFSSPDPSEVPLLWDVAMFAQQLGFNIGMTWAHELGINDCHLCVPWNCSYPASGPSTIMSLCHYCNCDSWGSHVLEFHPLNIARANSYLDNFCDPALGLVACSDCTGDLNADGIVNAADLGIVIGTWGTPGGQGDVNGDGTVNAADLGIVIGVWGNCP